jgi:hypothetical protein
LFAFCFCFAGRGVIVFVVGVAGVVVFVVVVSCLINCLINCLFTGLILAKHLYMAEHKVVVLKCIQKCTETAQKLFSVQIGVLEIQKAVSEAILLFFLQLRIRNSFSFAKNCRN